MDKGAQPTKLRPHSQTGDVPDNVRRIDFTIFDATIKDGAIDID